MAYVKSRLIGECERFLFDVIEIAKIKNWKAF